MSPAAEADLERLFDFLLEGCETSEDLDRAQSAIAAIRAAAQHPAQRELIIPFGNTGYRSADFIGDGRVVFNIGGNHYRLIVAVAYRTGWVYVKFVGTHADYDKVDAANVEM